MYRLTEPVFRPEKKYRHNNKTAKRKVTQIAFLFAVLLFMSIFLSWIKQQDLAVVILYKKFQH